jgi:hypothetical protein
VTRPYDYGHYLAEISNFDWDTNNQRIRLFVPAECIYTVSDRTSEVCI